VLSNTDSRIWPYYFATTLIAVLGSTAAVLAGLTTLAVAWTLNFSVIGVVMSLAPSLRRRTDAWLGVDVAQGFKPDVAQAFEPDVAQAFRPAEGISLPALHRYEWLGVRRFSRLLPVRRSPRVRLDGGRRGLGALEARSRAAELSHALIFLALSVAAGICAVAGQLRVAAWTMALNVMFNGYPVLLQRYTRARLVRLRLRRHAC
jgi:hypothetical protein